MDKFMEGLGSILSDWARAKEDGDISIKEALTLAVDSGKLTGSVVHLVKSVGHDETRKELIDLMTNPAKAKVVFKPFFAGFDLEDDTLEVDIEGAFLNLVVGISHIALAVDLVVDG